MNPYIKIIRHEEYIECAYCGCMLGGFGFEPCPYCGAKNKPVEIDEDAWLKPMPDPYDPKVMSDPKYYRNYTGKAVKDEQETE
jgi:hypothetical protein